jgi:hypothetical protein
MTNMLSVKQRIAVHFKFPVTSYEALTHSGE